MNFNSNIILETENTTVTRIIANFDDGSYAEIDTTFDGTDIYYVAMLRTKDGRGTDFAVWSTDESKPAWSTFSNLASGWNTSEEWYDVWNELDIKIPLQEDCIRRLADSDGNINVEKLIEAKRNAIDKMVDLAVISK